MVRKVTKKGMIRQCDNTFREYIRLRDKSCQRCGKVTGKLEIAHFYSRAVKTIRWDPENVCLLCFNCHYLWAHQNPREFSKWWGKRLGPQRMDYLRFKRYRTFKHDMKLELIVLKELLLREKGRECRIIGGKQPIGRKKPKTEHV